MFFPVVYVNPKVNHMLTANWTTKVCEINLCILLGLYMERWDMLAFRASQYPLCNWRLAINTYPAVAPCQAPQYIEKSLW